MSRLRRVWSALAGWTRRARFEREIAAELEATLGELAAEHEARGLPPLEARRRAALELGGVEPVKEAVRAARGAAVLESLAADVAYAVRALRRAPAFAGAALVTLALGIGGASAVWSVVRAALREPAYPAADRLVHLWARWPGGAGNMAYADFRALEAHARAFERLAAYESWGGVALTGRERPALLKTSFVSRDYFEILGARPVQGRVFAPAENGATASQPVAVVSAACWRRELGARADVVGSVIDLNGRPYTLVGVLDDDFRDLGQAETRVPPPDVWLPLAEAPALLGQPPLNEPYRIYWALGRLRAGATLADARHDLEAAAAARVAEDPVGRAGNAFAMQPLRERLGGAAARPALLVFGAAALILLLGAVNLASASLVRLERRRPEMAVRSALGASAARLVRQLVVEALVLAAGGTLVGLGLAVLLTRALGAWVRANVAALVEPRVDGAVLAVAAGLGLAVVAIFGVLPALVGRRVDLRAALAHGGTRGTTRGPSGLRRATAVAQIALAVVLLVGAGLLGRSLAALLAQDVGYDPRRLLTFRLDLAGARYADAAARTRFVEALEPALRGAPGVDSVTVWGPSLLADATWVVSVFPDDRTPRGPSDFVQAFRHSVNPGALANLGLPLRAGREVARTDRADTPLVAVISESLARELWPGESAVGKRLRRVDGGLPRITVVGVAGDARHRDRYSLEDVAAGIGPSGLGPQRDVYLPYAQRPNPSVTLAVRIAGGEGAATAAIRRALARLDPDLPLADVALLEARLARQAAAPRAIAGAFGGFALFGAFLAALGIYGVLAQSLAQRARELGVRMALGASRGRLLRREIARGLGLAAAGATVGVAGALALARLLASLLFGVPPSDPWTFAAVLGLLLALATTTTAVPAGRVLRRDAWRALREE